MSYINQDTLKATKRRPATQHLTPEEAIAELNAIVDKANDAIAKQRAFTLHWQAVAAELETENRRLRAENERLVRENGRLRKQAKPKAGKRKDEEWVDET